MNRLKAVSAFLLAAGVVLAIGTARADYNYAAQFPSTSGDLADPVQWGGTYAETMTLPVSFTVKGGGTYYFSSNVTFVGEQISNSGFGAWSTYCIPNSGSEVVIDQREHPDVVVTLPGIHAWDYSDNGWTTFKGGTYDIGEKGIFLNRGGSHQARRQKLYLDSGVVVTNVSKVALAVCSDVSSTPTTLGLLGMSSLFVTTDFEVSSVNGLFSKFFVREGSFASIGGALKTSANTSASLDTWARHAVEVDGADSRLEVGGDVWCGTRFYDTTFTVTNEGAVTVGGNFYTGYSGASNVFVTVSDASLGVATDLYVGYGSGASANSLRIGDSAALTVGGTLYAGYGANATDNTVEIKDGATVRASFIKAGNNTAFGNTLLFAGTNTTIDIPSDNTIALMGGKQNRLTFADGVAWTNMTASTRFYFPVAGTSNRFEVTDGAAFGRGNIHYLVHRPSSYSASSSYYGTIFVGNGATLYGNTLSIYGQNDLIVSNGTFACRGGWNEIGNGNDTQVRFILQGRNPKVTGGIRMGNGQTSVTNDLLRFEVPAEGYASADLPIFTNTLRLYNTANLEADVSAWLANKENQEPVEYQLTSTIDTFPEQESRIAEANAKLPKGCRFRMSGNKLYLRCARQKGLMLIFR